MIKLLIFDWDGTLFDSINTICSCMLLAGKLAGANEKTAAQVQNIIGLGLDEAVEVVWSEAPLSMRNAIVAHYKTEFMKGAHIPPEPYEGVLSVLNRLKVAGYVLAVATGKSRRGLDRALETTATEGYFSATRCADETVSKPDPLMLNQLLAELNIQAEEALMIGDTEYDLAMATNAGMRSIGVSYGAHEVHRLLAHNPIKVIDHFPELLDILQESI